MALSRPTSTLEQLHEAEEALKKKRYASAFLKAQDIIKNNPNSYTGYLIAAQAKYEVNDYESAIHYAEQTLRLSPTFLGAYTLLIYAHFWNSNFEAIILLATRAMDLGMQDPAIFQVVAESHLMLHNLKKACDLAEKAVRLMPDCFEAYYVLARATWEQFDANNNDKSLLANSLDAANKALEIAEKKQLNPAQAYSIRAEIYLDLFEYDEAITDATMAINLNAEDPINYHTRAKAYQCLNNHREAMADLDRAIYYADENDIPSLLIARAKSALALEQFQRTIEDIEHVMALGLPVSFPIMLLAAQALYGLKEYDYSIANLSQIKNDPLFKAYPTAERLLADSYIAKAKEYMQEMKWHEAIKYLSEALSVKSKNLAALALRAKCFRALGEPLMAFTDERAHFYISREVTIPSLQDYAKYFILQNIDKLEVMPGNRKLSAPQREALINCDITPETINKERELRGMRAKRPRFFMPVTYEEANKKHSTKRRSIENSSSEKSTLPPSFTK